MTGSLSDKDGIILPNTMKMNVSASIPSLGSRSIPFDMARGSFESSRPSHPQKPKSSPSTPSQRPQANFVQQTSPSTGQPTREGSPRSTQSESSHTTPGPRRPARGCKFEAGMAKAQRRVPYSLGPERLDSEEDELKKKLGPQEEITLTAEVQKLYARLLPNAETEQKKTVFVQKLEGLLQAHWPNKQIKVSVFGSTGNCLGTSESDIDICITTDCKELEHVCSLADLLDRNGMERIVCVSSARVPIVKIWDPQLQVACDMNVNNPIALENTQMVRSYTAIDERFRPLAMAVKYWAKKRILNDAALGGTLSSYTWICMVLNFLQTRDPPILPSLQQKEGLEPRVLNGVNVAYDQLLDEYKGFGSANKSSLGQLLFQFFRYYGHELDFERNVVSVRLGKVIPKTQKAWHLLQDNRLCVEEPFNISRNLANTADDTSMRGIHLELRRAHKLVAEGKLDVCCEQYQAQPEARKHTEAFIHPVARPIIPQAPVQITSHSNRNGKNSTRGGKHGNRNSSRRASNPAGRNPTYLHDLPFQMTPQELQLQAQHQQHLLHDQLFQQYQYLQLQEQELRMQLYQQSLRQRGMGSGQSGVQNGMNGGSSSDSSSKTINGNTPLRIAMTPTLFNTRYSATSPFLRNSTPATGVMTNPASPMLGHATPDNRRYTRRASVTNASPAGSLRAQSQPARVLPFGGGFNRIRPANDTSFDSSELSADRRPSYPYHSQMFVSGYASQPASVAGSLYEAGRRPAEYMGYYVGQSPSLLANSRSAAISPLPSHAGLAIHNGGLSPKLSSRSSRLPSVTSSPSLQSTSLGDVSELGASSELTNGYRPASERPESPQPRSGPLIIDSSVYSPHHRRPTARAPTTRANGCAVSASTSDDLGLDTPSSSDDQYVANHRKSLTKRWNQNVPVQVINGVVDRLQTMSVTPQPSLPDRHTEIYTENNDLKQPSIICENPPSPVSLAADEGAAQTKTETRLNGASVKKKKTRSDQNPVTSMETSAEATTPLGPITNGQDMSSIASAQIKGDTSNGWQTQRKKKPRKIVNDTVFVNSAGGDVPPVDESLRKGG